MSIALLGARLLLGAVFLVIGPSCASSLCKGDLQ
jgi:hypothetical protein